MNYRIRLFLTCYSVLTILLSGVSSTTQAQVFRSKQYPEDSLQTKIWRVQYVAPGDKVIPQRKYPYAYLSFDGLVYWQANGTPIRAIQVNSQAMARGGLEKLKQLRDLQVVDINLDTNGMLDSLFQALAGLPVRYINFSGGYGPATDRLIIPASIQKLTQLARLTIGSNNLDYEASFESLAGVPTLRTIRLYQMGGPTEQTFKLPKQLEKLTQLTEISLNVSSNKVENTGVFGRLTNLKELTISAYGRTELADTEKRAFSQGLLGLLALEEATLPAGWLVANFSANWPRMQKLSLMGGLQRWAAPVLQEMPQLSFLSLQNVDLPTNLCQFSGLTDLSISGDSLKTLPDCLGQLTKLERLLVSGKLLRTVPLSIGRLTNLKMLEIANTTIDSLPDLFADLNQLKVLQLSRNRLRVLPNSLVKLGSLTGLTLDNNQLTRLPDDLDKLRQLRNISINNNKLRQLPERLGNLKDCQNLNASNNQLTQLPASIGQLKRLKQLSLNNNQLSSLPDALCGLDSLGDLTLNNNKLTSLPADFGKLQRLRWLYVDHNQLTKLPESAVQLAHLLDLSISENPLESLPEGIGSLTALTGISLRQTKLRMLPSSIGQLKRLTNLVISNSELITLPREIGNCAELAAINLDNNPLMGLPESVGRLKKLRNLTISGRNEGLTPLMELPDSLRFCTDLQMVQLSNLPNLAANEAFAALFRLPKLIFLSIVQTPLNQLPPDGWKETSLVDLTLANNALTTLPPALLEAPKLRSINLYGNPLPKVVAGSFGHIDQLRVAMAGAGWVTLENAPTKSTPIAEGFMQSSGRHAAMGEWADAEEDLEKAIGYAPDTVVALMYAQRAEFYFFRKQFDKSLADFEQALGHWPALKHRAYSGNEPMRDQDKLTNRSFWWLRKAMVRQAMGQTDAALADISQSIKLLPVSTTAGTGNPNNRFSASGMPPARLAGMIFTEQGKILAQKSRFAEADSAYGQAMTAYEQLPYAEPASQLTVVELGIITGQYARAKKNFDRLPDYYKREGNGLLAEYLNQALRVAEGTTSGPDAVAALKKAIAGSSGRIINWSFELFESWLNRTTLATDRRDALRELTELAKTRQFRRE